MTPVESTDLLFCLLLETSFYVQQHFKAFRSLRAYNQIVSGFITSVNGHIIGEKRCLVVLFKQYLEERPEEMKKTGPFYLAVIDKPQTSAVWYKKTPMGKNTINNIMEAMKEESPLKDVCPEKKLTSHIARKTVDKKLKSSGIANARSKT